MANQTAPMEVKQIITAIVEGRIIAYIERPELTTKLLQLINKIHANCGQAVDGPALNLTLGDLAAIISKEYPRFTFSEIEIAFQNGWQNIYGEFYGLNNKTYLSWVKSYSESKNRLDAKKAIQNASNSQHVKPEPTEAEKEKMVQDALVLMFNARKIGKHLPIPSAFYDYLSRKLLIGFTTERKITFQKKAIEEITAEQNERKRTEPLQKNSIDSYLDKLSDSSYDVIARAKQIAVQTYFDELIELGEDFELILKETL